MSKRFPDSKRVSIKQKLVDIPVSRAKIGSQDPHRGLESNLVAIEKDIADGLFSIVNPERIAVLVLNDSLSKKIPFLGKRHEMHRGIGGRIRYAGPAGKRDA